MDYYDRIAPGYDELHREEQEKKIGLILPRLKPLPPGSILDVGCGTGLALDAVARATGRPCLGADPSEGMLARYGGAQETVRASAEHLPFEEEEFAACISVTAVQNFSDIPQALQEMRRVTKRGGPLIISCLKRSPKARLVAQTLPELVEVEDVLEEEKDLIFCCRRKT